MIPAYVPFVFYSAGVLCLLGSLYVAWELFKGVFDFVGRIRSVIFAKKQREMYERQARAMGNVSSPLGLASGEFNIMGQQAEASLNRQRPIGVCSRENPHATCNGKPRGDCTNGR